MKYVEFIAALVRLSKNKIGMAESAFLMCCMDGAGVEQLSKILGIKKSKVRGRGGCLKKKDLIQMFPGSDGRITYYPTESGNRIIKETLKRLTK